MQLINAIIIFFTSNFYIFSKKFNIEIPIMILLFTFTIINLFPTIGMKKFKKKKLMSIRNAYTLLEIFLISNVFSFLYLILQIVAFHCDYRTILINILFIFIQEIILFWNGIIRLYIFSRQIGIKYRTIGAICGMIPIVHLIILIKMIKIAKKEVQFENDKYILNENRKEEQICKTKYPILLVHGVFFRDLKIRNYWGRIPKELIENGATCFYGNHSSALSVEDSGKELANRIKEIVKENGIEKLNIIAHSKGGLDCRYAISECNIEQYVASLTMISTPNRGCEFADFLFSKDSKGIIDKIAKRYNSTLKHLGESESDFKRATSDLTSSYCYELNKKLKKSTKVFYQSIGTKLIKSGAARFPLNMTAKFVKYFDGDNDGLVGEKSFEYGDKYIFVIPKGHRGISHGDIIDLNRENIDGFDVREFYVELVHDLKKRGF